MVNTETVRHEILQVSIVHRVCFFGENGTTSSVTAQNLTNGFILKGLVSDVLGGLGSLLSRVNEDKHLVSLLPDLLHNLGITNVVHRLQLFDGLLFGDTDEFLLERARTVAAIEMERALDRICAQETSHITVVRKGSTETHNSYRLSSLLGSANRSADDALKDGATFIVEEMNLVDDNKADKVGVASFGCLSGNDVVLLRGCDDDLGIGDLLLGELTITCELGNSDTVRFQALAKVADLFLNQSLQGRDVYNFEVIQHNLSCFRVAILPDFSKDREHSDIGLSGTRGSANKQISIVKES